MGTLSDGSFNPRIVRAGAAWTPYLLDATNYIRLREFTANYASGAEIAKIYGRDGGLHLGHTDEAVVISVTGVIESVDHANVNATFSSLRTALRGGATTRLFDFYWYYDDTASKYFGFKDCKALDFPWKQIQGPVGGRTRYNEDLSFTLITTTLDPIGVAAVSDSLAIDGASVTIKIAAGGTFRVVLDETVVLKIDSDGNTTMQELRQSDGATIT